MLSSQAVQKQVAGRIWFASRNFQTPLTKQMKLTDTGPFY